MRFPFRLALAVLALGCVMLLREPAAARAEEPGSDSCLKQFDRSQALCVQNLVQCSSACQRNGNLIGFCGENCHAIGNQCVAIAGQEQLFCVSLAQGKSEPVGRTLSVGKREPPMEIEAVTENSGANRSPAGVTAVSSPPISGAAMGATSDPVPAN